MRDFDAPVKIAVEQGTRRRHLLDELHGTFKARGGKRVDVLRLIREPGELQAQAFFGEQIVRGIGERGAILQRAGARAEGKRLRSAEHVRPRDFENSARAGADGGAVGVGASSGEGLHLESKAVTDGVAPALLGIDHHHFQRVGAIRILRSDLHAIEHAQIVETPLRIHDVAFAQRSLGLDRDLPRDNSRARELVSREENL